jgi:very-short-patch-repair endonuclease
MKLNNPSFREDVKEKIRNSALKRWKELGSIKIGKMESKILNETETILNYKILRQYSVKGFSVDGYIPELNLVIEIDEKHHYINGKLRDKDINRQKVIEKELKCIFLRIKDDISEDELKKALNEIKKD